MNTDAPPRKAKAPLRTAPAKLTPNYSNRKSRMAETQALRLTLPIPHIHAPVDFDAIRSEAARLAREFRKTGQARHYRALLSHCAGAGLRIAMVGATTGDQTAIGLDLLSDAMDAPECAGCGVGVANDNLGGHDGRSALTGRLWCTSCADGEDGAR